MDLNDVKQELLARQAEVEARIQRTHKHTYGREEPVSPNFNEQIKQTENDALVQTLEEEGKQELVRIRHALARLESGDYLQCAECGEEIGEARLKAIPYTDKCIDCASAAE